MKLTAVSELRTGDRLGQPVYRTDGRLMLNIGTILTEPLIAGLQRVRVSHVYIDNMAAELLEHPEAEQHRSISSLERLRLEALDTVRNAFIEVSRTGDFHTKQISKLVDRLVYDLSTEDSSLLIQTKEQRDHAAYLYGHSVNVCMLAILTGRTLGYTQQHLRILGMAALLHDIGYVAPQTLNAKLDHPRVGFDMLRKHEELPLLTAHIVLQHHEQVNGAGFPLGVKGEEFRKSAQICAIANDFDHFVNEIGQNRLPHEGIEYVMSKVDSSYDFEIVSAFVKSVTPYPIGTVVRLSNGMVGKVTELHKGHPTRPVITTKEQGLKIDLLHFNTEFIEEVIVNEHSVIAV